MSDIEVRHRADESRYEAWLDDELAGFAAYRLRGASVVFTHTEVADRFEGHGVGGELARGALDAVRAQGDLDVIAECPFIKAYIDKHEEYADLLHRG